MSPCMIYRPQFKYITPPGFRDVPHAYYCNVFTSGVAPGVTTDWTPFQMDDDADFYHRAFAGDFNNGTTNYLVNFRDSALVNYFSDLLLAETVLGGFAGCAYAIAEEKYYPKASHIEIQISNPSGSTVFPTPILRGVKRCRGCAV